MVWIDSQYMKFEHQDLAVVVSWLYHLSSLSNDFTALIVSPLLYWFILIFPVKLPPPPPFHVAYCWDVVRTIWYQEMPFITCRVNSWRIFFSTKGCSSLWLTRKRLPIVTYSWCHMHVTLYINFFNLFQYVTVDGWYVNRIKWNKCWIILF